MKKNLMLSLMLAACSWIGFGELQAQTTSAFEAPEMKTEIQAMADEVISFQLSDPDAANKTFSKLLRKVRNDKEQLVAVGAFFLNKNIYPCARQCAQQVYTVDPAYIPGLMLSGHVAMLRKDWGTAGQKFDEILNYEPENIEALRLNARVYKYVNTIVAKETLAKIIALNPKDVAAYKELGDIAYHDEDYKEAVKAYQSFFEQTPNPGVEELRAGENYLLSLMNQKDFFTIKEMAAKLLPIDPKDLVVRRMKFFSEVETFDAASAESIKYLTEKQYDDSLYLYLDYLYASIYASELLNNDSTAIEYLRLALQKDEAKADGYKKLANLLRKNKQPFEAIDVYKKYLSLLGDKVDEAEKFGLANIYISAKELAENTEDRMKYILAGDKIFAEYMEAQPTNYRGPYFRATLWITNPQEAEEKPREYYAQAVELIGDNADYATHKKRALQYLMIYALKTNDDATCKKYVEQVLALDPADQLAIQIQKLLQ
ncbi:hypothetical protein EII14_02330 [Alloprevotella sp. OH1205_COT-284]|uniref:tetratricopeptide repeat protein n=1 Tax=Alloprevotella sp. OH1205_COT-284 TaxID=2491043 RepID=UPI000F5EB782|nr:tetratricopeptide repeat protein [Alloprevotella sp. OH1205_COT-284]RRD80475.1 hypothetical protein EII14_02330 [Alloprevotella sp. OH1205_COT-284]